jgi:UDP-N-acetylglucosamine 1-carboxyvinyltransferase
MGATIKVESNTAIIEGIEKLTGAVVSSPDLRGGVALVMAGLMAEGFTVVENVEFIERGYENFEAKMQQLGALIIKADSEDVNAIKKFKLKVS